MRTRLLTAGLVLVVMSALASGASTPVPLWEADVEVNHPHSLILKNSLGDEAYWYFTYKVTNPYTEPKTILPVARLVDNMGNVYLDTYAPDALQEIADRTGYTYGNASTGSVTIEPGAKKRFVALFKMPSRKASTLTFSISGLSARRVEKRDGEVGVYSRVYKVEYYINGDQYKFTPDRLKVRSARSYGYFDDLKPKKLDEGPDAPAVKLGEATADVQDVPAVGAPAPAAKSPLALLPGDLEAITFVNVRQLADAGLLQDFMAAAKESGKGPDPEEFLEAANLDPEKDIDSIVMGIASLAEIAAQGPDAKGDGAIIVAGNFDTQAVAAAIKKLELGGEPLVYKGYDLLLDDDGDLSGVLDGKFLVTGSETYTKKVIDIYKGDAPAGDNSNLISRVDGMKNQSFWFTADVAIPPMEGDQAQGMAMMAPGFDPTKIKNIVLTGLAAKSGMNLDMHLNCDDAADANAMVGGLKNAMNGLAMMGNMMAGDDPAASKAFNNLLKSIKISNNGSTALVQMKITPELIEAIKAKAVQGGPGGGAPVPEMDEGEVELQF